MKNTQKTVTENDVNAETQNTEEKNANAKPERSTTPHIALSMNTGTEENPKYESTGTISYGQKPYTINVILDQAKPGDQMIGRLRNGFDINRIGKGIPVKYCDAAGNWSDYIAWIRPAVIESYNIDADGKRSETKEPTQVVFLSVSRNAQLPKEGKKIARLTGINYSLRAGK